MAFGDSTLGLIIVPQFESAYNEQVGRTVDMYQHLFGLEPKHVYWTLSVNVPVNGDTQP